MLYYSQTQLVSMEKNLNIDVMKENLGHINLERNKEKNVHQDHSSESRLTRVTKFKSSLTFDEYKWLLQTYSIIASLYHAVGNTQLCEKSYVKYIQLLEKFYHQNSLETTNAYFLVGVFYFEENMNPKAIACFRKALAIRQKIFGRSHLACSDCLLNLGVLYKQRRLYEKAHQCFEESLVIRQQCVGVSSLPACIVHEELGKYYLEQSQYKQSYMHFKQCYDIRRKIFKNKRHKDIDRVATLLVFLHRKIDQQIEKLKHEQERGTLPLLQEINQELQVTITEGIDTSFQIDESFSFLLPQLGLNDNLSIKESIKIGNQVMKETLGLEKNRQKQVELYEIAESETDQSSQVWRSFSVDRIVNDFKVSNNINTNVSIDFNDHVPIKNEQKMDAASSDTSIEKLVDQGVHHTLDFIHRNQYDRSIPYAISLMLSLSPLQWNKLNSAQNDEASENDPLVISSDFKKILDAIQQDLFENSMLQQLPRYLFLSGNEQQTKNKEKEVLTVQRLIIPEQKDQITLRRQQNADLQIYKLLQKAPDFIQSLHSSQTRIFQNIMICNLTLRYFFVSVQPVQYQMIKQLLEGLDTSSLDHQRYLEIFTEFQRGPRGPLAGKMPSASDVEEVQSERGLIKMMTYRQDAVQMLEKFQHIDDFDQINPYSLGIDEEYLRNIEAEPDESHTDDSFVDELGEYQANLDSQEPDYERMVEILTELLTSVLDTQGAYVLYRAILTVYNDQYNNQQKSSRVTSKNHGQETRAGYLQELQSSESYEMRSLSSKGLEQSEKTQGHINQLAHNTLSSNRKTLNITAQSESLLEDSKDQYDSKSVGHKRQASDRRAQSLINGPGIGQKRHSVKRHQQRQSVLRNQFPDKSPKRHTTQIASPYAVPHKIEQKQHSNHRNTTPRETKRTPSSDQKNGQNQNNLNRPSGSKTLLQPAINSVLGNKHHGSITIAPQDVRDLSNSAKKRHIRNKSSQGVSRNSSRLDESYALFAAPAKGKTGGQKQKKRQIMLEESGGNFMSNPTNERRGHSKDFSGPSSSIMTETSQSYTSAHTGMKKQFQSNNAPTTTNDVEDEDDEVAQLMQNYENLLGGLEMGQTGRERNLVVTESSSPTHSTSRFMGKTHSGLQSQVASQARLQALSSECKSLQESVNCDKPVRFADEGNYVQVFVKQFNKIQKFIHDAHAKESISDNKKFFSFNLPGGSFQ